MSYVTETEVYKGYKITIESDEDPLNPRTDWDNACTMVCWHNRYNLGDWSNGKVLSKYYNEPIDLLYELAGLCRGDEQELREGEDISSEELMRLIEEKGIIIAPLYLYDHSGITISMGGFSCPWDSGQVGFIYIEKDKIQEEWGGDYEKAQKYMEGEVESYDDYLTGNVWRYNIEETNDSCGGWYGDEGIKDALQEARSSIDHHIARKVKKHVQQVKEWISNKVPLIYRKPLQLV